MSEENVPRLRLKSKLTGDPATTPPAQPVDSTLSSSTQPPLNTTPESLVPPSTPEAPKFVRLKPRLSATPPAEPVLGTVPAEVPPSPEYVTPLEPVKSPPEPAAETASSSGPSSTETSAEKPTKKFSFKPKVGAVVPNPPPARPLSQPPIPTPEPGPKVEPLVMPTPPSPGTPAVDTGEEGEPAEITAIRAASSSPFPPTTGKFPPPTAGRLSDSKGKSGGSTKKLAIYGLLAVVVLGGGFYAYTTFMAEPPPPPPKPKLAANPTTPQGQAVAKVQALVDQANQAATAAVIEIMPDAPKAASTTPAATTTETPANATTPAVVTAAAPVAPPPPTVQFKAWVENLRISGVRAGANTKVFIGGTAYGIGDLVNPQLGIVFEGYNSETRLLMFKDKTGATVERRN